MVCVLFSYIKQEGIIVLTSHIQKQGTATCKWNFQMILNRGVQNVSGKAFILLCGNYYKREVYLFFYWEEVFKIVYFHSLHQCKWLSQAVNLET